MTETMTITNTRGLAFGSFAAVTGGTVVIAPNGVRSKTGAVYLVASSTGASAQFSVSSTRNNEVYSITLPGTVTLTRTGGGTMAVSTFTSTPSGTGTLGPKGVAQTLNVGATLTVGSGQAAGSYTGTFNVTVVHQ